VDLFHLAVDRIKNITRGARGTVGGHLLHRADVCHLPRDSAPGSGQHYHGIAGKNLGSIDRLRNEARTDRQGEVIWDSWNPLLLAVATRTSAVTDDIIWWRLCALDPVRVPDPLSCRNADRLHRNPLLRLDPKHGSSDSPGGSLCRSSADHRRHFPYFRGLFPGDIASGLPGIVTC